MTNETMYSEDGEVIETTDFIYEYGALTIEMDDGRIIGPKKKIASIKIKKGYDKVGVWEYDLNGNVKADYFLSVEDAEAKFGKLSHTEILEKAGK